MLAIAPVSATRTSGFAAARTAGRRTQSRAARVVVRATNEPEKPVESTPLAAPQPEVVRPHAATPVTPKATSFTGEPCKQRCK